MIWILIGTIALAATLAIAVILLASRNPYGPIASRLDAVDRATEKVDRSIQDGFSGNRRETADAIQRLSDSLVQSQGVLGQAQANQLDAIAARSLERTDALASSLSERMTSLETRSAGEITVLRRDSQASAADLKTGVTTALADATTAQGRRLSEFTVAQSEQWNGFRSQVETLRTAVEGKLETLRTAVDQRLRDIQQDNATKLDQMRQTVDEKLQSTLETRLGESFKQVSERLEQVYKGLGEMQALATGVGDLKRVLSNVKTRGTWGEIQLATLLEQVLAPDQYATNVNTSDTGAERVEFAIRLPGRHGSDETPVWLPIDSKFPLEDYQALVDASQRADAAGIDEAGRQLERRVKDCAKEISTKYLNPPKTTDFGIMFLPNEGLYAEVLRRPGLPDFVQREYRIILAGPTTLWAILNSLQMGFRTLAIERRSSEIWSVLGAVKTEFGKFGVVLDAVHTHLHRASAKIDEARKGTRTIARRLTDVQELPAADGAMLLESVFPDVPNAVDGELEHV